MYITCISDIDDICKFNGTRTLVVTGRASNSGVVDIKHLDVHDTEFTKFNSNFKSVESLRVRRHFTVSRIVGLTNLKTLSIGSEYVTNEINEISDLDSLEELNLYNCTVRSISNLSNIKRLKYDSYKHLPAIDDMISLEKLEIVSSCYIHVHDFTKHINLRHLNLGSGMLLCSNVLHTLDISGNVDIEDVSMFTELRTLIARDTCIENIDTLVNLEVLDASSTYIENFSHNTKLHTLILQNSSMTKLSNINNVEELDISFSTITKLSKYNKIKTLIARNSLLRNINNVTSAVSVDISGCKINKIPNYMPNLTELNISNIKVSELRHYPKLVSVIIYNDISPPREDCYEESSDNK